MAPTTAFAALARLHRERDELYLWDFDGYDHARAGSTLQQVLVNPRRKMGHAFVLAWGPRFYRD